MPAIAHLRRPFRVRERANESHAFDVPRRGAGGCWMRITYGRMDENRARRVADALRDRGIDAHLETAGIDIFGVRIVLSGGREAIWGNEGTTSLEAEVLLDGDLVGFIPEIPGSAAFDEAQIVDAIARADYEEPIGRELPEAPPPAPPLMREGGLFRRFLGGFREDS